MLRFLSSFLPGTHELCVTIVVFEYVLLDPFTAFPRDPRTHQDEGPPTDLFEIKSTY